MYQLQLLSEIKDFTNLKNIIESKDWIIEQKIDGQRVCLSIDRGQVKAYNRKGVEITFPTKIKQKIAPFTDVSCALDGEYLNGVFYAFDMFNLGGHDISFKILKHRKFIMRSVIRKLAIEEIKSLDSASETVTKAKLIQELKKNKAEGVVAKKLDSQYLFGNKSPDALKYKFYKSLDCVVGETWYNDKQSCQLLLKDEDGTFKEVAKCKVTPSILNMLNFGDVVEVKYLYATSSNRLYQPIFTRLRNDKHAEECGMNQMIETCKTISVKK